MQPGNFVMVSQGGDCPGCLGPALAGSLPLLADCRIEQINRGAPLRLLFLVLLTSKL